ncbi:hypothetical protein [Bacillus thuringiensis]|uniref:hypothetical protein n=1 Tax=Bacillus thuringiensis TaxID=1428 RepID=UPI000BFDECCE|nr:hypothetical protein [Bacillus thuringiensis]PGT89883.1 hypothetical protein COD17_09030 [Bacillus thuringiensis]
MTMVSNRSWEALASSKEDVRTGVMATTSEGTGVIVDRNGNLVVVAFVNESWVFESKTMPIQDVHALGLASDTLLSRDRLYLGAMERILNDAHETNREYEKERSKRAVVGLNDLKGINVARRVLDTGNGSATFVRLHIPNLFDFEICETVPLVGDADLIEYAKALANEEGVTGRTRAFWHGGRIRRVEILLKDINFGKVHSGRD